jgi:guanine deaminase
MSDLDFLARCIELARTNVTDGGGPFGAVVVRDGQILGEGVNRVTIDNDPSAHAEIVAIREACRRRGDFQLDGAVVYTSCEPCPMCLAAILWARADRVVHAADRYDAAKVGFDDLAFYELFDTPRDQWRTQVVAAEVPEHTSPFDAWAAHDCRTSY